MEGRGIFAYMKLVKSRNTKSNHRSFKVITVIYCLYAVKLYIYIYIPWQRKTEGLQVTNHFECWWIKLTVLHMKPVTIVCALMFLRRWGPSITSAFLVAELLVTQIRKKGYTFYSCRVLWLEQLCQR